MKNLYYKAIPLGKRRKWYLNDIVSEAKGLIGENEIVRGLLDTLGEKESYSGKAAQSSQQKKQRITIKQLHLLKLSLKIQRICLSCRTPTELHTLLTEAWPFIVVNRRCKNNCSS